MATRPDEPIHLPLLDLEIASPQWEVLSQVPCSGTGLSTEALAVLAQLGCVTLAEAASLPPNQVMHAPAGRKVLLELTIEIKRFLGETNGFILKSNGTGGGPSDNVSKKKVESKATKEDGPSLCGWLTAEQWHVLDEAPIGELLEALIEHKGGVRAVNVIRNQGYTTLGEVARTPAQDWGKYRNFGRKSLTLLTLELEIAIRRVTGSGGTEAVESDDGTIGDKANLLGALGVDEAAGVWEALTAVPVSEQTKGWLLDAGFPMRAVNAILRSSCSTLADVARTEPSTWLALRGFGKTSLVEMQAALQRIVAQFQRGENSLPLPLLSDAAPEVQESDPPESLAELVGWALAMLDERRIRIVGLYFGRGGETATLQEIAEEFGLSRERIRQLKFRAKERLQRSEALFRRFVVRLMEEAVVAALERRGGIAPVAELRDDLAASWGADAQWADAWFTDTFGAGWFCLGSERYKADDETCALCSHSPTLTFATDVASHLRLFGYAPLTLDACAEWYGAVQGERLPHHEIRASLAAHPDLRLFEYGDTQVGLISWPWYDASYARQRRSVEWALRLQGKPSTAETIAGIMRSRLGILDADAFSVADTCEGDSAVYVSTGSSYGLRIWYEAEPLVEPLEELLRDDPQSFEALVEGLQEALSPSLSSEHVAAALMTNPERFFRQGAQHWARADVKAQLDLSALSFDDLIPD